MKAKFVATLPLFTAMICLIFFPGVVAYAQEPGAPARKTVQPGPGKAESPGGGLSREKGTAGATQAGETSSIKARPMTWEDKDQQARCEAYLPSLKDAYEQTIAHTRRGDGCTAVLHGKAFLDLVGKCRKECPKGFLENNGYSQRKIHEAYTYYKRGLKKCPGSERLEPAQPDPK